MTSPPTQSPQTESEPMSAMPVLECSACFSEARGRRAHIGEDIVCSDCFTQLFKLAIGDESEYPAHWGPKKLSLEVCRKMLSPDIIARYEAAVKEYDVPAADRVYCRRTDPPRRPDQCHAFVGRWTDVKECVRCEKCMWYTCLRCEETYSTGTSGQIATTIEHDCDPRREDDIKDRVLRGLRRGIDYQICPKGSCGRVWSLHDGCNHLVCASCKTDFCFVCGDIVEDGRRHWRAVGGCPRWNLPGDANAHFDDTDEFNDNDDLEDLEAERFEEAARRIQQEPAVAIDAMIRQAMRPALIEGRVFLMMEDRGVQALLQGLTMHLDLDRGDRVIFRDSEGTEVHPLNDINEAQMPHLIIRPRRARRAPRIARARLRGLYMIPDIINNFMLRMLGLRRRDPAEREVWRE